MHPIELLFYLTIFIVVMILLIWLSERPSKSERKYEQRKIQQEIDRKNQINNQLNNQRSKVHKLKINYKERKSKANFLKKQFVDNSELLKQEEVLQKIEAQYQRNYVNSKPAQTTPVKAAAVKEKKQNKNLNKKIEDAVNLGLHAKDLFDFVSKIIK